MKKKSRKRPLTPEEKAVCDRLNELWEERKEKIPVTQDKLGEALGITQGAVGHYLHGRNAIGFEAMFRWAQLLRVHPYEIDPNFRNKLPPDLRTAVDAMDVLGLGPGAAYLPKQTSSTVVHIHEKKPR